MSCIIHHGDHLLVGNEDGTLERIIGRSDDGTFYIVTKKGHRWLCGCCMFGPEPAYECGDDPHLREELEEAWHRGISDRVHHPLIMTYKKQMEAWDKAKEDKEIRAARRFIVQRKDEAEKMLRMADEYGITDLSELQQQMFEYERVTAVQKRKAEEDLNEWAKHQRTE
jgi:hypothetical protein